TIINKAMAYFSDLFPTGNFGQPLVPTDLKEIRYRDIGDYNWKRVADARTMVSFANFLQNGYTNYLDVGSKAALRLMASAFGDLNLPSAEKALYGLSQKSITRGLRSTAFTLQLGLSPFRQALVQSSIISMLSAINPKWMVSTKVVTQPAYIIARTIGDDKKLIQALGKEAFGSTEEANQAWDQYVRSGVGDAVDKNTLSSSALNDYSRALLEGSKSKFAHNVAAPVKGLLTTARKGGFDTGEYAGNLMSWLAH